MKMGSAVMEMEGKKAEMKKGQQLAVCPRV